MRRFWMLLLTLMALAALLAVPAMAAETTGTLGQLPASVDAVASQVVPADTAVGTCLYAKPADMSADSWLAYEALVRGASPKLTCADGVQLTFEESGIYVRSASEVWHCYCGYGRGFHEDGCVELCGGYDVKWKEWSGGNISESGHYYLTKDVSNTSQVTIRKDGTQTVSYKNSSGNNATYKGYAQIDVVIDMNGHNRTNTTGRALQSWYGASVTLCNSVVDAEGNPVGGVIAAPGVTSKADHTNVWHTLNATPSYDDYSTGSKVTKYDNDSVFDERNAVLRGVTLKFDRSLYTGTNTYVPTTTGVMNVNGAPLYVYGGTLQGDPDFAISSNGGVLTVGNAEVYIYEDATLLGGKAKNGGVLFVDNSAAEVYIYGTVTGGNVTHQGGVIYINKGTVLMEDGVISGGFATNGSNIYVASSGTLKVNGGQIKDAAKTGSGQNVFVVNGALEMTGGEIAGDSSATNSTAPNATVVKLSGSAKITGTGLKFSFTGDGTVAAKIQVTAPLNEDAQIVIGERKADTGTGACVLIEATSEGWADYASYVRGADPQITTIEANRVLTYEADGIHSRSTADGAVWHCVCGANDGEAHIGDCDGYDVKWLPYELTGSNALPNTVGHWYLVDADGTADNAVNMKRCTGLTSKNGIFVDFNGIQVTQCKLDAEGTYNDQVRFGNIWCDSATVPNFIVYTDSSQGHTGKLIVNTNGQKNAAGDIDHSNIWLRSSESGKLSNTLSLYRMHVDCSEKVNSYGSGFSVGTNCFLNLYECHVIGGTSTTGAGAAIYNSGSGTVTVKGGSITGGSTFTKGGAIYNGGTMTLEGVTIYGGTSTGSTTTANAEDGGGAIFNAKNLTVTNCTISGGTGKHGAVFCNSGSAATATITGGSITGGTASTSGGTIYNTKNLTLNNVTITGGTASTSGGNIYTKNGNFTATGCTITGGTTERLGGTICVVSGTATFNDCDITADQDAELAAASGAVARVYGGTMIAENGTTITGAKATYGGAVYTDNEGNFVARRGLKADGTTQGDAVTITGGEATYGGAIYVAGGTVTVEAGSVIEGGRAGEGGNVYVAEAGEMTISGATVRDGVAIRDCLGATDKAADRNALTKEDGRGANFFVAGTLTLTGTTVQGGYAHVYDSTNAEFASTFDSTDGDDYGGSALCVAATGEVTAIDSFLYGYTEAKVFKRAGTIYNQGKITLTNTEITASATHIDSGCIYNRYATAEITMTGGKIDASNLVGCPAYTAGNILSLTYAGAIRNAENSKFTLVSGDIYGFCTTGTNGGASVSNSGGAVFNMQGGTIHGTTTTSAGIGGAVSVVGGTFNMSGGTIDGGEAYRGGAVYQSAGTFNMSGGTIQNGKANTGGNVYIEDGTFKVTGTSAMIKDGRAVSNAAGRNDNYSYGGNMYIAGGTVQMTAGTIQGGTSIAKTASSWAPAGNVYVNGGTFDIKNVTIKDGQNTEAGILQTGVDGNNLYINYNATVYLREGTRIENTANNAQENITMQGGRLYIQGATITAAEGVKGYNLRTNSSSLTNKTSGATVPHFNYVDRHPRIEMTSGTISNAVTEGSGANLWLDLLCEFTMTGGTIENGKAVQYGANIYAVGLADNAAVIGQYNTAKGTNVTAVDLAPKITIGGDAKIIGGVITNDEENGGSIHTKTNTTLLINGNAEVYGGESANCGGNIYSNGYVTIGGNAKIYNGKVAAANKYPNIFMVDGFLTLQDQAQVAGGIGCTQNSGVTGRTITLKGSPVVKADLTGSGHQIATNGLQINSVIMLNVEDLSADADVEFYVASMKYEVDETSKGYILGEITGTSDISGLTHISSEYFLDKATIDGKEMLILISGEHMDGVLVNGEGKVQTFEEAIANLGEKDYVTLINDRAGDVFHKDVMIELNGHSLTDVVVEEGVELKIFDEGTLDYNVKADPDSPNGFSGYGTITLSEDSKGTIARSFNTPKATAGGNYRFVVIKDEAGYHAHRIYLTVKSTILYPNSAAVNYRTVLRCDQVVAKYINENGGGFGILVTNGDNKVYGDYTENGLLAQGWDSTIEEENNLITRLSNILKDDASVEENKMRAGTTVRAQAYIFLNDQFYGENAGDLIEDPTKAQIGINADLIQQMAITSSGVESSLQDMVAIAFAKDPASIAENTKQALYLMYNHWSDVMDGWNLPHLQSYKDTFEGANLKYACLCGDPKNERGIVTPCSKAGHPKMTWRELDLTTGKLPTTTGNYYLTDNLQLVSQGSIPEGQYINLNLNGHSITSAEDCRIANVFGMFNVTNFGFDGETVEEGFLTAKGAPYYWNGTKLTGGNGGALLITGTSNVSLYTGVTVRMAEDHKAKNAVVEVSGKLNIYGGNIIGATMKKTYTDKDGLEKTADSYGGAVNMSSTNAYLYMNSGSITGGEADYGGTIRANGRVELEGGTITAGTALDGAMIYMEGGELENRGVNLDASAGLARRGGLAYVKSGTIVMYGTAQQKLTLTGGAVYTEFRTKTVDGKVELDGDSSINAYGSGGVFYVAAGTVDLDYCVLNGGATRQKTLDGTIGNYTNDLDSHGGTVIYIANGSGNVTVDACELNGYVGAMAGKRGGNIYMVGGTLTVDGDENVNVGSTLNAGWTGVNSPVVYMTNGTFTMNEKTTLTAANVFNATSGVLKNGVTYGGVVGVAGAEAEFNMNGGIIEGGVCKHTATHGGGNVAMSSGTFNMHGGQIRGGIFKTGATTVGAGGGNIRISGGTFNMTGGRITDGVDYTGNGGGILVYGSAAVLKVSGNAYIYGNTDGENANNVFLSEGKKLTLEGALTTGAKVGVTMAESGGTFTIGNTVNTAQALENGWLESDSGIDTGLDTETNQFYMGKYSCVCGGLNGEHLESCSKELHFWEPWTDTTHLPNEAGFWYLAYPENEVTISEQANIGVDATAAVHVALDLNGKTVKRAEGKYNNRFYALNGADGHIYTLTITDNSVGRRGKLVCANEGNGQGLGVWLSKEGSTLNLLAGTIDAGGKTATLHGGMAVYQEADTVVNMYGGALIGGNTDKHGGAVYMASGAAFTMKDGTITGGTIKGDGGAIYMSGNTTFTMDGGTIVAGHALCSQTEGAAATVKDVVINGSKYTVNYTKHTSSDHAQGGAVCMVAGATFTMNDGLVKAPDNQTQRNAGYGGLFSVAGTLNMYAGTITGGSTDGRHAPVYGEGTEVNHECSYGGNIYITSSGTMNMYGGTVENGNSSAAYLATGTYVKGEETLQVSEYGTAGGGLGGNIDASGKLNIYGGTVDGGIAETGGNIGTNSADAEITLGAPADAAAPINEKTVQIRNGQATTGGNLSINVRPAKTFVINEGTWIEGGHADNGGNIAISPWTLSDKQYVQTGTDANDKKVYATEYDALIAFNGGTITGGTAKTFGGNIYLYGRSVAANATKGYPKSNVNAAMTVGQNAVISNGAAESNGNNVYFNTNGKMTLAGTIRNTLNEGDQITVGEETITTSLNNVYMGTLNSVFTLESTGAVVNEKAADAQTQPVMRNVYLNSGNLVMNGGTISGGYTTGSGDGGGNIVIKTANAHLTVNDGLITNGAVAGYKLFADTHATKPGQQESAANGGNIYIELGTMTMTGGTVSNGTCVVAKDTSTATNNIESQVSGAGGNIYVLSGELTLEGDSLVTGGKIAKGGGANIMLSNTSTDGAKARMTMRGNAQVTDGLSTRSNGGNIFVSGNATFLMQGNASVTGGRTYDGGGNIYGNGTVKIEGGTVSGGVGGLRWASYDQIYTQTSATEPTSTDPSKNNANIFLVGGFNFQMSGGLVEGGLGATASGTTNIKPMIFSGAARVTGNGLYLGNHGDGVGHLNPVDVSGLQADGEVFVRTSAAALAGLVNTADYLRITADIDDVAYLNKLVKEADPNACQVAYLTAEEAPDGVGGIYLLNGSKYRYNCICGSIGTEEHLPGCDGTEVLWKPWKETYLPAEPGNWYLTGLSTKTGTSGEKYVALTSTGTLRYDYYQGDDGKYVALRALLERDENGALIKLEDGTYKQAMSNGKPVWLASNGQSIAQIPEGKQVLDSYTVRVDLNGYKLDGVSNNRNLTFYGRGDFTASTASYKNLIDGELKNYPNTVALNSSGVEHYETHRQASVNYTITDSSVNHTSVLATYGKFSGNQRNTTGSPQGTNIWMPSQNDTLNTYRTVLDSSNVKLGWGQVITTQGTVNLCDTEIVGGVAQSYYGTNEEVVIYGDDGETVVDSGWIKNVSGSTSGGAIYVEETAVVNMYGGTIRDGISVYRYMSGSSGVAVDRNIGGGNVFVIGEFNVTGTDTYPAAITGGMALNYVGDTDNELSYYSYAQGGGVYLYGGKMTVTGNVSITDNYTGTVNGTVMDANGLKAENGTGLGIIEIDRESIVTTGQSNVFLNGNVIDVKNLTGTVGFSMIGTDWQGNFAAVDNGSTAYVDNAKLVPDVAQTKTHVVYQDGYLRFAAQAADTLQVGYGVGSIHPTQQDIANGLSLGGYGNNSYASSKEEVRFTRYWANPTSTILATDANHELNETTAPMEAVAMAFRDTQGDTVIIVNLDYNSVSEDVGTHVKQMIAKKTGVSVDNITISASHQHTGPSISKQYWTNLNGEYTMSYEEAHDGATLLPGTTASGTYAEILYGNPALKPWEPRRVRTDYATTFYTGIVEAAVMAYNDLAPVSNISAGIMDTTTGGNQFNFVRNVALYDASDLTTIKGMITDNHITHRKFTSASNITKEYYFSRTTTVDTVVLGVKNVGVEDGNEIKELVKKPESELDVTMQLVKYERQGKPTVVLANFQSHPHIADGSNNLNPTGGVVKIFRDKLSQLFKDANGEACKVLYFSGAGGNVNSGAKIEADDSLQPWYEYAQTEEYKSLTVPQQRAKQAISHGETLAGLANAFVNNAGQMKIAVDPAQANVQVSVYDFGYTVWNEKETYTVGSYTVPAVYSATKVANAKLLYDANNGGYQDRPGAFGTSAKRPGSDVAYWFEFQAHLPNANDRIYSFFHANGVNRRTAAYEEGGISTGHFEIKAYDLGGIGFVSAPYEMFQENGQAIKGNVQSTLKASQPAKYASFPDYVSNGCGYVVASSTTEQTTPVASPYPITIIASQTTGARGYIPSVLGYVNGGYATDTTLFAPGTGEQLVTAYVDMLIGLNSSYTTTTAEGE